MLSAYDVCIEGIFSCTHDVTHIAFEQLPSARHGGERVRLLLLVRFSAQVRMVSLG